MTWILPVLLAWAVLALPGYLVLVLVGARVPVRWGWSPVVTVVVTVVLSGLLRLLQVPWQPGNVLIALLVLLGVVRGARWMLSALARRRSGARWWQLVRPHRDPDTSGTWTVPTSCAVTAASVVSGVLAVAAATRRMGGIDTLNGSYDSFFHLSAIAFIRDGEDAFLTTALNDIYGAQTFYPVVFDALAALLPYDTVLSANALMLAMLAALPSALAALVATTLAGARHTPVLAALGAAASVLFLSIPAMGLVMGLWPVVLGSLCLPLAIATVWRLLEARRDPFDLRWAAGGALVLVGTALAHPSILFSVAVTAGLLILVQGVQKMRNGERRRGLVQIGAAAAAAVVFVVVSGTLLAGMHLTRHSSEGLAMVLWEILADSPRIPVMEAPLWPLAVVWLLAGIGAVASLRRHETVGTTAVVGVIVSILLGVSTQIEHPLTVALVNPWYGARERIAPLMMCLLILLLARGVTALLELRRGPERPVLAALAVVAVLVTAAAALVVPQRLPLLGSLAYTAYGLQLSPYVTPEERDFIERTAENLPEGSVVLADPLDGATLYWSLGGVETVYPTMSRPLTRDTTLIANYAAVPDDGRQVCEAYQRIGPTHLYRDLSAHSGPEISPEASARFSGVHEIPDTRLTVVERAGPYALYELEPTC